jgi:TonB-dependent starch-binding outer membrane protein SusC
VTGKVTDSATGELLPGVSVIVKGTTVVTATGVDGNYSISAPRNSALIFSFVGYTTEEVSVGNRSMVNVSLKLDVTDLDEVVVVGYGTQKRANVVGAVASVDGDQLDITAIPMPGWNSGTQKFC